MKTRKRNVKTRLATRHLFPVLLLAVLSACGRAPPAPAANADSAAQDTPISAPGEVALMDASKDQLKSRLTSATDFTFSDETYTFASGRPMVCAKFSASTASGGAVGGAYAFGGRGFVALETDPKAIEAFWAEDCARGWKPGTGGKDQTGAAAGAIAPPAGR